MRFIILAVISFVLLLSCNDKNGDDSNLFIGAYRTLDQLVPYPYFIQQKNDSVFLFNNSGQLIDKILHKNIKANSLLKFSEKHLKFLDFNEDRFIVFDAIDTLNFKTYNDGSPINKYGASFIKVSSTTRLGIEDIKHKMENLIWHYKVIADENSNPNNDLEIEQLLHFNNDSLNIITNYYYEGLKTLSQKETKAYRIFQIEDAYFLSYLKEDDNPQPIYQILAYDSDSIELRDFSSRIIKDIHFNKSKIELQSFEILWKQTQYYSNCFDGYQGEYYHGEDVTYNKGNNYIIDYVNVDAPKNEVNSGYIIVHFNINCNRKVGRFGLIQMDRNYKNTSFSKEMIYHILSRVSSLSDFPSTDTESDWYFYKDVHAFLMFKLENGKIIDLCP